MASFKNIIFQVLVITGTLFSISQQRPSAQYAGLDPTLSLPGNNMLPVGGMYDPNTAWGTGALPQMGGSYPLPSSFGSGGLPAAPFGAGSAFPYSASPFSGGQYPMMGSYPPMTGGLTGMAPVGSFGGYFPSTGMMPMPMGANCGVNPCAFRGRRLY